MAAKRKRMGDVGEVFRGDIVAAANEDAAPKARGSRSKPLTKVMYKLDARQIQALRAQAFRRAQERGSGRPDASEVLREVLDAWIAGGGGK